MTISRTKTPDWAYSEVVTSAQLNALDANVTNALDKRSGQTDTLESDVTATGLIVISGTGAISVDGGGELLVTSTGEMNVNGPLKVFGAASYVELDGASTQLRLKGGATGKVQTGSSLDIESGGSLDMLAGSTNTLLGTLSLSAGGTITAGVGGNVNIGTSGALNVSGLGSINVSPGAVFVNEANLLQSGHIYSSGSVYIENGGLQYGSPQSKSIWVPIVGITTNQTGEFFYGTTTVPPSNTAGWPNSYMRAGAGGSFNFINVAFPDWAIPQGATLTSIDLFLRIKTGHVGVPGIPAHFWAYRMAVTAGTANPTVVYLNSGTASDGTGVRGIPSTASVAAYEASGNIQQITYTCNQNNVISKTGLTSYGVIIRDEDTQVGNIFHGLRLNYTGVSQIA